MMNAKYDDRSEQIQLWDALLDQNTAILGATADFETLSLNEFDGTILTPETVLDVIGLEDVYYHAWVAIRRIIGESSGKFSQILAHSMEQFIVELGIVIRDRVNMPHLTYLDPRFCNDTRRLVAQARRLVRRFEESGVPKSEVAFTIPATEAGIRAAHELENKHDIQTNLTLVTGVMHASACAEAGATTITMLVRPLMEWYEKNKGTKIGNRTCRETIQATQAYFRMNHIKSKLVGAEFRSMEELASLGDFDAVALSRSQVNECYRSTHPLSIISPHSSAWFRATQALFPTTYLANPSNDDSGFSSAMSSSTLGMIDSIHSRYLAQSCAHMLRLQTLFVREVRRQIGLETLDLGQMHRLLSAQGKQPKDYDVLADEVTEMIDGVVTLQREEQTEAMKRARKAQTSREEIYCF